ncbi:MAG: TonB-dependent receptor [Chitinophagaceae bacterium]|nr:TonB-dependent receptor [Chitinophagaceae bacterium]
MHRILLILLIFISVQARAQKDPSAPGIIIGFVLDGGNNHALSGATVKLALVSDSNRSIQAVTVKDGSFLFENLAFGYYRLRITMQGYATMVMDSIHIRTERFDFDLNEIKMNRRDLVMEEVVVYAEKPLIENKDGKIIFNTGESALSSGATTTELLKQTPLVSVDNDGKVMLRGKEPKVLIDDKPVELNARQLQDLLESMPGSMIEKIEVMTTPPPQYASERGGVINIITKKGKVGFTARINLNYGTRGEAGLSGNISYRKNKFAVNFSAGYGYSEYAGSSYSNRQNIYTDSVSYFNITGNSHSQNRRPNLRLSIDYDLNKRNSFNFTTFYNNNNAASEAGNTYSNISNALILYRLSDRATGNETESHNPNFSLTYTHKGKTPGEVVKLITGINLNSNDVLRNYFQQYLNPDLTQTGLDSTQLQNTTVRNHTISIRFNYDKPMKGNKLKLNTGANFSRYNSHNILHTEYLKKPEQVFLPNGLLSNDFRFHQTIFGMRFALRYDIVPDFYINAGIQVEHTETRFDLSQATTNNYNGYWTALPFGTIMKKWKNEVSVTFSYKRTIQRPGLNELNPSVDYSDPYNTRFGNPLLQPWSADNFDLIAGKVEQEILYQCLGGL